MLTICLITLGDPATLTGGYRYHRRMAELAACNDARLTFASLPPRLPFRHGRRVLRAAAGADVVLIDSIAAAYLAPWIALRRPPPADRDRASAAGRSRSRAAARAGFRPGWTGSPTAAATR